MKIIHICVFFKVLKLNISAHELDCSKNNCNYENIKNFNYHHNRQLGKKLCRL